MDHYTSNCPSLKHIRYSSFRLSILIPLIHCRISWYFHIFLLTSYVLLITVVVFSFSLIHSQVFDMWCLHKPYSYQLSPSIMQRGNWQSVDSWHIICLFFCLIYGITISYHWFNPLPTAYYILDHILSYSWPYFVANIKLHNNWIRYCLTTHI